MSFKYNKHLIWLFLLLMTGCASTTSRMETYKEKGKNTAKVQVSCDLETAKRIVRDCIKEAELVERPELGKSNFIFANTGYGDYLKRAFGSFSSPYCRVGFFFDSNSDKNTVITIVEENASGGAFGALSTLSKPSIRQTLVDKIKLKTISENL